MRLGLDFDNTLVSYDGLFHRVALDEGLIPASTPAGKSDVRQYLRDQGREEDWTRLQGEVYGRHILQAQPYPNMLETLKRLSAEGVSMWIVSHKTRSPYLGTPCDLHEAARGWLVKHGFHEPTGLAWPADRVFFELTIDAKVERIADLACTHYVDDLPDLLQRLPDHLTKILFAPHGKPESKGPWRVMTSWTELPELLRA